MYESNYKPFQIFNGKRVLITGHTGFKGSWLTLWLTNLGCDVAGFAFEPPTQPSNFEASGIEDCLQNHVIADVRDYPALIRTIDDFEPDLVMHLAAQSVVKRGYEDPLETISTNVMGTANVLEAVRQYGQPCGVLCVTSDKCYRNKEQAWGYREKDEMGDLCPYGGSKGAAEIIIHSFRESYFPVKEIDRHGVWLASARAGNVIGGGDWTDHALIVDCIKSFHAGEKVIIRNPHAQRPWQHVLQCLSGYMTLAAQLLEKKDTKYCSGWNFGPLPGNELPVIDVVKHVAEFWGFGQWEVHQNRGGEKREAQILRLAIDKAIWQLKWKPCWDVEKTLRQTVNWYQEYFNNSQSIREFSLQQIHEYESAMQSVDRETAERWA